MKYTACFSVLLTAMILAAPASAKNDGEIVVFVSITPQRYFVQQICGNLAAVSVMVPPGASPTTYEPKPAQMKTLSKADLYFAIGVPFEQTWLPRFASANPRMQIIRTDKDIDKMAMTGRAHGDDHSHNHAAGDANDPHIWLSPPLVKIQVRHMLSALAQIDPANASIYRRNSEQFTRQLDALHAEIKRILSGAEGSRFMVFHPSWGYFARAYGLEQIPIEIEGKAPKPAQLQKLIRLARDKQIKVIFVQPQFSTKSAELIAKAIDGRVVTADPLATDWAQNLLNQAAQFKAALR